MFPNQTLKSTVMCLGFFKDIFLILSLDLNKPRLPYPYVIHYVDQINVIKVKTH